MSGSRSIASSDVLMALGSQQTKPFGLSLSMDVIMVIASNGKKQKGRELSRPRLSLTLNQP